MICSILTKAYNSYSSYFALLSKGIKANRPNFLDKNSQFNLIYTYSKIVKEDTNKIKLYTSTFIANNYNKIYGNKYVYLDKNKYIDEKYLKNTTGKIKKKDNYVIDNNNKRLFIEKTNKHIIDSRYISLTLPDKTTNLDIKMIEIVFINNQIKISLIYDTHLLKNTKETINIDQSISIDLGMKNLMTIYNPTGTQKIIDGKFISSINTFYNNKLAKAQSINDNVSFNKYQMKRLFIINNYFNNIVKWMEKEYSDKKLIIIGYNKEWKQNTNMGRVNNLKFNKIPYMKLINKIKLRFSELNKFVLLTEESYTSKCDSLSLEEVCVHETYLGKRTKRGLFSSATNKLINADINGAINIMRKQFLLKEIKGIRICNPDKVKIFREVHTSG